MKRLNLSIILILFFIGHTFAQQEYATQYEVQYDVTYSIDSLHLDKKTHETVYLYTGSDYGVFMNYRLAKADEIRAKFEKQTRGGGPLVLSSNMEVNFNKTFYKNLEADTVKTVDDIAHKNYIYIEPKTPRWQIKDSTKTFKNYPVQKAITRFGGRDYVVWFTTQIPIPDGPYLFCGLPGLIVELYDTRNEYHFKLKSIQKLDKPKTWTIPEAKSISKAKFKKLKIKASKNVPSDRIEMGGMTIKFVNQSKDGKVNKDNPSAAKIRRMNRERLAQKNNPMELK